MLTADRLRTIVHQEVPLIVLSVLLVAARVGVLAWPIAKWSHNHILYIVVNGQVDRRLLHFGLLLSAATSRHCADTLLTTRLVRQYRLVLIVLCVMWIDVRAVRISHASMLLLLSVVAVVLLLYSLVRPTWMLVSVAGADDTTASLLGCLFGVSAVFARSDSGVWADHLAVWSE